MLPFPSTDPIISSVFSVIGSSIHFITPIQKNMILLSCSLFQIHTQMLTILYLNNPWNLLPLLILCHCLQMLTISLLDFWNQPLIDFLCHCLFFTLPLVWSSWKANLLFCLKFFNVLFFFSFRIKHVQLPNSSRLVPC